MDHFELMFIIEASVCVTLARGLPREGSRIQGFIARQADQTRRNDTRAARKLTHYRIVI
jgi:hypothetical protein